MQREMKNLFEKEKMMILNIHNAQHQAKVYLEKLNKIVEKEELTESLSKKAKWYKKIFKYYHNDLIPAIEETAEMEIKHIAIFDKNPDEDFHPEIEVQNHQHLTRQFLDRFEEIHAEFYQFTLDLRK